MDNTFLLIILFIFFLEYFFKKIFFSKEKKKKKEIKKFLKELNNYYHLKKHFMPSEEKYSLRSFLDENSLEFKKKSVASLEKSIQSYYKKYLLVVKGETGQDKFIKTYHSTLLVFIVVFAFRTLVIQPFQIPTNSMFPSLNGVQVVNDSTHKQKQDFLSVFRNKAIYGKTYYNLLLSGSDLENAQDSSTILSLSTSFGSNKSFPGKPSHLIEALQKAKVSRQDFYEKKGISLKGFIHIGDHLFVDRLSYFFSQPKRGDMLVFFTKNIYNPYQKHNLLKNYYVKRLVAFPNERVRIYSNGDLKIKPEGSENFIHIQELDERFQQVFEKDYHGYQRIPESFQPITKKQYQSKHTEKYDEYLLGENQFFALGDNTENSLDSRYWGTIDRSQIIGKALFIFWPFGNNWGATF